MDVVNAKLLGPVFLFNQNNRTSPRTTIITKTKAKELLGDERVKSKAMDDLISLDPFAAIKCITTSVKNDKTHHQVFIVP